MQRWLRQSSTRVSSSNVDGISVFAHLWLMSAWYLRGIKSCSAVLADFSEVVHQFPSKSRSGFIKLPSTQLLAVVIVAMIFALLNQQKLRGVRSQTRVRDDKAKRRGAAKAQNPSIYKTIAVLLFFHTPQYSHHKKYSCDSFSPESSDPSVHCQSKFTARIPWGVVVFMATHERIPVEEVEHE